MSFSVRYRVLWPSPDVRLSINVLCSCWRWARRTLEIRRSTGYTTRCSGKELRSKSFGCSILISRLCLKLSYFTQIFWQLTMPTVKTSLLLFYFRLFYSPRLRMATYAVGALIWSYFIASTIVDINVCTPPRSFWLKTTQPDMPHHCINYNAFFLFGSVYDTFTNLIVLILPLPTVWHLQINTRKKVGLSFIFLLGSL